MCVCVSVPVCVCVCVHTYDLDHETGATFSSLKDLKQKPSDNGKRNETSVNEWSAQAVPCPCGILQHPFGGEEKGLKEDGEERESDFHPSSYSS